MNISNSLSLAQKQQLKLSPQLLQSFELMALPLAELQARIKAEIEANPALELPGMGEISYENYAENARVREQKGQDDTYSDSSSYGSDEGGSYDFEASDRQQKFMENALSTEETLQEHLLSQLGCEQLTDQEYEVGLVFITNFDANGFFTQDPQSLLKTEQLPYSEKVLDVIQRFEPLGVGARNWRESLILQAKAKKITGNDLAILTSLVNDKLELMRANKQQLVAKQLGIELEELESIYSFLKTLTPYPGQSFANGPEAFVIPDLSIHQVEGNLVMKMNNSSLPDLTINAEFESLAQDLGNSREAKETQSYIQHHIKSANDLIFQVRIRNQTLYRVGEILMDYQREFFYNGPQYLRPLTQKTVADILGVHETTISRISTAKYIDTDWGIIAVKKLFSNAVGDEGEEISKNAAKETIRQIIQEHQGTKALSDQKISDLLKERGISVARRTVAKYRNELNIDPSFIRGTN
ncbi:RNA polymerase sigma-54 factor [Sphaerochaeta pleomorpha str. Grapes]|uniref:RNA polymerase sigma-54 factor n=1 Tax=Sphaerochaeta pleomorpha (strain ATCC BAA-1885 / DSM 22778 / Grapes) TaxID=158190 RepID=G8QT78_SPHPG|nr:RNA polymerase factor sigma-54 [Sphaerochaeta pleomorpha]AEV29045.1 RNA polymerase sigma-54 factor [Sphaerochaeta pleomorpha str. Grapes]